MGSKTGAGEMPARVEQKGEAGAEMWDAGVAVSAGMQESGIQDAVGVRGEAVVETPGKRPDFNIVQPEVAQDGKTVFKSVGALWKKTSKMGRDFYTLKIGKLRLLVFANEPKRQ